MKEVEISIKGLFFYILKHCKSIVLAMLIGAVILGGFSVVRDAKSEHGSQATVEAGVTLTDSEKAYVNSVYDYLNELRTVNESRSNSLIMSFDSENLFKTELTYMVSVDVSENMEGVEQAYRNYLSGSEFAGYISEKTGIDNMDITETVTISYERSRSIAADTVIKIIIVSGDRWGVDEIAKVVDSYLVVRSEDLKRDGYEHELTIIGNSTYEVADINIQNRQLQYLQEIQSRNKTILDTENALKDAQKDYYDYLVKGIEVENGSENAVVDSANRTARPSVKYIVLGLLLGAFMMCGIYFLIYIFANRLDEGDDVESVFGTYLIGTITGKDYGKVIYKLQHLGKRTFEFDESVRLISTKIKMAIQKDGVSIIGIMGCGIKKNNEKAANDIIANLKKDSIEAIIIDEPIYDPTSAEKLSGIERVVLLEKAGITYRTEIWKEMEMVKKLGIKTEGLIIAE